MSNLPLAQAGWRMLAATCLWLTEAAQTLPAAEISSLLEDAAKAEQALDSKKALALYQEALAVDPENAKLLQKIARQYSDLVVDQPTVAEKISYAQRALDYAQRAVALEPNDPVNVLSLAICYGKLAVNSDTSDKVRYSRFVKSFAERALELDPNYAWAHHVLGRWHYEVASLNGVTHFFVRLIYGGLPSANVTAAIDHLNQATKLEPDELNHFLELGFAYAAAGQMSAARAAWRHGLAMPSRAKHDSEAKTRARIALQSSE